VSEREKERENVRVRTCTCMCTRARVSAYVGLFFLTEFLAQFIFYLFLPMLEKKGGKVNRARSSTKKNRSRSIACTKQLIAASASRSHPRRTVSRAAPACLLYSTHHALTISFYNLKTKLRTNFCQRKSCLRIRSRICPFKDIRLF
jgi:hypothetical protein